MIQSLVSRLKGQKVMEKTMVMMFFLLLVGLSQAALSCKEDKNCRRDVCIDDNCKPRSVAGGPCNTNSHCASSTDSCISELCTSKSPAGGPCETNDSGDCAVSSSSCVNNVCLSPTNGVCSQNDQCASSPDSCIGLICKPKEVSGGPCDSNDNADCASGHYCSGTVCALNSPAMVWDGNKAPSNPVFYSSASVAIGKVLYSFETGDSEILVEAYNSLTNTWTTKTGPGISASNFAVVAIGDRIFLIGGTGRTTFYSYETGSDMWDKTWNQLPETRSSFGAAVVGKTVFIFGGAKSQGVLLNSIRSIDTTSKDNQWNLLTATLPQATFYLSATAVDTDVYLVGGSVGGNVNTVLKFNTLTPSTNPSSSGISPMLLARINPLTFFHLPSNRLYAVGGINSDPQQDMIVEYLDLANPSGPWVSANALNPLNTKFASFGGGLIDNRFYFLNYQCLQVLDVSVPSAVKWTPFPNVPTEVSTVYQMIGPNTITVVDTYDSKTVSYYNTITNSWSVADPSSNFPGTLSYGPASAVINGEVFVMGGYDIYGYVIPEVWSFKAGSWLKKDNIPENRAGGCAAVSGTDIFYYGGGPDYYEAPTSTLYKMDTTKPANSQWSLITPASGSEVPTAVSFCSAVVVNGKLLIFGGGTDVEGASPVGLVQTYNIASNKWETPTDSITPRSFHSAVFLKGFVFITGGYGIDANVVLGKTEIFEVNAKVVSTLPDMPTPRFYVGLVTDGSSVFALGGTTPNDYIALVEKLHTL